MSDAEVDKLRKQLRKAHRSSLIVLKNTTKDELLRVADMTVVGKTLADPPKTIAPGKSALIAAAGKGVLAGCEGSFRYGLPGLEGCFVFTFNNGKDKDKRVASVEATDEVRDSAFEVVTEGAADEKHQEITWTVVDVANAAAESAAAAASAPDEVHTPPQFTSSAAPAQSNPFGEDDEDEPKAVKIKMEIARGAVPAAAATSSNNEELLRATTQLFKPPPRSESVNRRAARTRSFRQGDAISLQKQMSKDVSFMRGSVDSVSAGGTLRSASSNVSMKDVRETAQRSMQSCFLALSSGNLESALKNTNDALTSFASLSDTTELRKELRICAVYKVALALLLEVKAREADIKSNLHLLTFLTLLPLRAEDRLICCRRVINENIAAGNYGIAERYLAILLPLGLRDKDNLAELRSKCIENGSKDTTTVVSERQPDGSLTRFCCKTFKQLDSNIATCSLCMLAFDPALYSRASSCPVCALAFLA